MGSSRSHPLPEGIFVEMESPLYKYVVSLPGDFLDPDTEFENWSIKDLDDEIDRLNKRIGEIESERVQVLGTTGLDEDEYDSDDVMNDPDVRDIVERGGHICHIFDGECLACTMDEE